MNNKYNKKIKQNIFINKIEKVFLKNSITIKTHKVYISEEKKSLTVPIVNSSGVAFIVKIGENYIKKIKEAGIYPDFKKEIKFNKEIFYAKTISTFAKDINSISSQQILDIGQALAITIDYSFLSKISKESDNYIEIDSSLIDKKNEIELGKSIIKALETVDNNLKNNFFFNNNRYFYTTAKYYLAMSLAIIPNILPENINYYTFMYNYGTSFINNHTGFKVVLMNNLNTKQAEKNGINILNGSIIGLFHHEEAIGTIKTPMYIENDFIKFNIGHEIFCKKSTGIIKYISN